MKKYTNRYGDVYTFTPTEEGNVLWQGPFHYCRFGMPNDYTEAYEEYINDGGDMSLEQFEKEVHNYDADKGEYIHYKYLQLVTCIENKISMIDPSGGPYMAVGMNSEYAHPDIKDKRIVDFKQVENGYEIILG